MDGLVSAFVINFFAELGDKTQLAVIALSAKYPNKLQVFAGAYLGLILAVGFSVLVGGFVAEFISPQILKTISGVVFVFFGIYTLFSKEKEDGKEKTKKGNPFLTSLTMLFLMEMGDKTQLANFLLGASYPLLYVFLGAICAMGILSGAAVLIGNEIQKRVNPEITKKITALLFVLIGIATILLQ